VDVARDTVDVSDLIRTHATVTPLVKQLAVWRRSFTIQKAIYCQQKYKKEKERLSCAVLCSGGCLSTIAAIRSGFKVVWSSEINREQQSMFQELTGCQCLGDTFGAAVWNALWVHYMKSGQPCIDYSLSGKCLGANGETGWMFVEQVKVILQHRPWAFCLEISDNAPFVNKGEEVQTVRERLSEQYVVYGRTIRVWQYGDPSNRKRLYLVGLLKELGQIAREFTWPTVQFCAEESVPVARCIAVPDAMVPERYWRPTEVPAEQLIETTNDKHRLQVVARLGKGMGHSSNPHTVLTWEGLLNTQTSYNGGGQRPKLDWQAGQAISGTRLTVPIETVRAASHDDSESGGYADWASSFCAPENDRDDFVRLCVNNGEAQRTSVAIDDCVMLLLKRVVLQSQQPKTSWASLCWGFNAVRRMLFDTGANGNLNFRDVEQWLRGAQKAAGSFTVANKGSLEVGLSGRLAMIVLNSGEQNHVEEQGQLEIETTTADVSFELFSFDPLYRQGWGCDIQPMDQDGGRAAFLYKDTSKGRMKIPLQYDWSRGGFWLHYLLADADSVEHRALLARHRADDLEQSRLEKDVTVPEYDVAQTREWHARAAKSNDVVDIVIAQHSEDRAIRGTKAGLKSKQQKMPIDDFHEDYGHLGCCGKRQCLICRLVKGAARKIFRKVDPHRETRPGYKWHMDTVTWSDRSEQGNKYMTVIRCEACDFYVVLCHYLRSDVVNMFQNWVRTVRADPAFHDCSYKMISVLCLDNAGEWARECALFKQILDEMGITPVYSCPDRKESAALAERAVGIVEVVTKALLMQNSLPAWWWQRCAVGAVFLLNRFPTAKLENMAGDGDAPRPLELYSRFTYSRRQIDRELSYWVMPGTPALVQTTAKGSELGPKTRWGIAVEMYMEQVVFMCPYKASTFRSKSFAAFKLTLGMNYAQWLGLGVLKPANKATAIPVDFKESLIVQLPSDDWYARHQAIQGEGAAEVAYPKSVVELKVAGALADQPPVIRILDPNCELGGSVQLKRTQQTSEPVLKIRGASAEDAQQELASYQGLLSEASQGANRERSNQEEQGASTGTATDQQRVKSQSGDLRYVDLAADAETRRLFDQVDAVKVQDKALMTDGKQTFVRVCKSLQLPFEQHELYRRWLIDGGMDPDTIPVEGHAKVQPGLNLTYPSGDRWRSLVEEGSRKSRRANHVDIDWNQVAMEEAEAWVDGEVKAQQNSVERGGQYCFNVQQGQRALLATKDLRKMQSKKASKKAKRTKAVAAGRKPDPANTREAVESEDCDAWVKAMGSEFYGLIEMGVFELGFTAKQLVDQGITAPPVPCAPYFENKYGAQGKLDKNKVRVAIQGHPGNMQKGVHYDKTFSATPQESTCRVLCALVVLYDLFRGAFDITKAFCWADLPTGEQIAVKYPEGFKEYDEHGNELFMILRKNLYGHPAAGRQFGKQRDSTLLERFNENGWKATRCRSDPCLFWLTRTYDGVQQWMLMLVHVDDCDLAGTTQQIVDDCMVVCRQIWKCTDVDPEYMLGVRRRLTRDETTGAVVSVELDMIAFVEGMFKSFEQRMPGKKRELPMSDNFTCSMADDTPQEESRAVLDAGYQCAMGMLLWAARRVYSSCRVGVSILCRVMSRPSWRAFYEAMGMIQWMYEHRQKGLKFSKGVNWLPLGLVDASNKPDPKDGKCQFGYVIMLAGAPVVELSKKLVHIGLGSGHNEYMALHFANQGVVWLRNLLTEIGLQELVRCPTVVLEDNKAAITWATEDMVTMGNQYIYIPYHYNKEVQEEGLSAVTWVQSGKNISDLHTKCVGVKEFRVLHPAITGYDTSLVQELFETAYKLEI
jgi:site-specific DNA-cytosine methylase